MQDKPEVFTYSYSAEEQQEIKDIREKYLPREDNKLEELRRLDNSLNHIGQIVSISFGVVSLLIFGTGLCCILEWDIFALGVVVGLIGIVGMLAAYPLYNYINEIRKKKLAPRILELTEELLK